jgi:hypothetical protein
MGNLNSRTIGKMRWRKSLSFMLSNEPTRPRRGAQRDTMISRWSYQRPGPKTGKGQKVNGISVEDGKEGEGDQGLSVESPTSYSFQIGAQIAQYT